MADAKMHELNMQEGAGTQEAAAEAPAQEAVAKDAADETRAQNAAAEAPAQDSAPVMSAAVRTIYLALLIIMIMLPTPLYFMVRNHIDTGENDENRVLKEMPHFSLATVDTYPGDFDEYWNDRLPFKSQLVRMNGFVDYEIFKSSGSPYVIVGKEGWLFYKGQQANFEDPEADYAGTNLFTEDELKLIAHNMIRAKQLCDSMGCEFIYFVPPNKERVYAEYMPDAYGPPGEQSRMMQVVEYLRENTDVPVLCPYDELMAWKAEHPEYQVYLKYDTHWNNLGAYIGGKVIDDYLGFNMPELEDTKIVEIPNQVFDLSTLIGLKNVLRDDHVYDIQDYTQRELEIAQDAKATEFRFHNVGNNCDPRKVYIIGDSFSTMMGKYIACNFNDVYLNTYKMYDYNLMKAEDPQIIIYETVERYVGNLLTFDLEKTIFPTE